jgi:hypothetical protein
MAKFIVKAAPGYYATQDRKPSWVSDPKQAKVFDAASKAETIVSILRRTHVRGVVIPAPPLPGEHLAPEPSRRRVRRSDPPTA